MRVISHSDEIKLLERYHSGATGDELSEEYGISVGLITNIQKRHNQGLKRNFIDDKVLDRIIEMYSKKRK